MALLLFRYNYKFWYFVSGSKSFSILNNFICTLYKTKDARNISDIIERLYIEGGYFIPYTSSTPIYNDNVYICNDRIHVEKIGGGFWIINTYDLKGNIIRSCENHHCVNCKDSNPRCRLKIFKIPGSDYIEMINN